MALANHICWTRIEQNNQVRISLLKIKNKRESECTLDYSKFERSVYFVFNS